MESLLLTIRQGNLQGCRGLDIGTGPVAIYALLALARNPTWAMLASEVDESSIAAARANIGANGLNEKVIVVSI